MKNGGKIKGYYLQKLTKLLISHLIIALEYQTWYQSAAKT